MSNPNKIWTYSNALSMFRAVLTIPSAYYLWQGHNYIALGVALFAYITDIADGWLARKLDEVTEVGKIVDPIADKIYVAVITSILVIQNTLPLWFVVVVLTRDFVIMLAGTYIAKRTGFVLPSNYAGKIAVFSIIVMMVSIVAEFPPVMVQASMGAALVMMAVSFVQYTVRFVKVLRSPDDVSNLA
jgi:cardiolipin synthase